MSATQMNEQKNKSDSLNFGAIERTPNSEHHRTGKPTSLEITIRRNWIKTLEHAAPEPTHFLFAQIH